MFCGDEKRPSQFPDRGVVLSDDANAQTVTLSATSVKRAESQVNFKVQGRIRKNISSLTLMIVKTTEPVSIL